MKRLIPHAPDGRPPGDERTRCPGSFTPAADPDEEDLALCPRCKMTVLVDEEEVIVVSLRRDLARAYREVERASVELALFELALRRQGAGPHALLGRPSSRSRRRK